MCRTIQGRLAGRPSLDFRNGNPSRAVTLARTPSMPGIQEILGVLIVIFVIWFVLKMARVAIRLILFVIALVLVMGALYFIFVR